MKGTFPLDNHFWGAKCYKSLGMRHFVTSEQGNREEPEFTKTRQGNREGLPLPYHGMPPQADPWYGRGNPSRLPWSL